MRLLFKCRERNFRTPELEEFSMRLT